MPVAGCAQLLGLDSTTFEQKDAMVDAATVCDTAPVGCTSSGTGRTVCGQLLDTGATAGLLRAPGFTGAACTTPPSSDGPCALAVFGQPMASYFAGTGSDRIQGTVDDCGRFVVPDIPATVSDVAIVFDGATIVESATLLVGRPTVAGGTDEKLAAPVVRTTTETRWGQQIDSANPPGLTGGFLVSYTTTSSDSIKARVDGEFLKAAPTQPWGAYFVGATLFGDVDPALTSTDEAKSVLVVPGNGSHTIDGSRPGKTCSQVMIQSVGTAVVYVTLKC
jgi:hypothetical protein